MIYDPRLHGVTQGLLNTFMRCREEARLQVTGYVPLRTSQALQFGSLAHLVLEDMYGHLKRMPTEADVLKSLKQAVKEYTSDMGGRLSVDEMQFLQLNIVLLECVLPEYFVFWKKEWNHTKWAELEQKFEIPSPIPGVMCKGRIDGAFWIGKDLWSFESKTKGQINEDDISQTLSFDFQNGYYQRALRIKYKVRPRGTLYNIIRRPAHKKSVKESLLQFKLRLRKEVKKDPKHFFIRFEVAVPKSDSDRFEKELQIIMQEFVDWHDKKIKGYRNTSACMQKWGPCRFLPICANNEFSLYRKRDNIFPELAR
jgi:hypothetical protein